jgi:predicted nucleic acid-binding protein
VKLASIDPSKMPQASQQSIRRQKADRVLVLAEIRRGIELKRRNDPEQAKSLDRWFSQMRIRLGDGVLPVDEPVAEAWALLRIPDPLPLIDGLLAATAMA